MARRLTLFEHQASAPETLTEEQLAALAPLSALNVRPTIEPGLYVLTPTSYVGTIDVAGLSIVIRPKVDIRHVLFLVSYALDPRGWRDEPFGLGDEEDLLEAIVPALVGQFERATRRGLLQGYTIREEALPLLRGRLLFDEQLRRRYGVAPPAESRFDDYTEDIEQNRLLRAAGQTLLRAGVRSGFSRSALRKMDHALERVAISEYDRRFVPSISYNRLNAHYRPAVELARLVLRTRSFELRHGEVVATTFLLNMNALFETFITVALREALDLGSATFPQSSSGRRSYLTSRGDEARQPDAVRLKPDLSWWENDRCLFVGDVKYKRLSIAGYEHPDLYQLLSYTVAENLPGGVLIYAAGEAPERSYVVKNSGKRLEVLTVSLDTSPREILRRVEQIADRVRYWRALAVTEAIAESPIAS